MIQNNLSTVKMELEHRESGFRINDQWRICFVWKDGAAWDVEIVDYH